jgi:hypothetical protein
MTADRFFEKAVERIFFQKRPDQFIFKEKIRPELCMVNGLGIPESVILPYLLKTADIMQKAHHPCKIRVFRGQRKTACDPYAKIADRKSMLHLQPDLGIIQIVV